MKRPLALMLAPANRHWAVAAVVVVAGHAAAAALLLSAGGRVLEPVPEQPVVLIELPPIATSAPAAASAPAVAEQQSAEIAPPMPAQRIDAPQVNAPLPREVVAAPPPPPSNPERSRPAQTAAPMAQPSPASTAATGAAANTAGGSDPRAQAQEADYISLVNSHLARRKRYPAEARQARQQGVVTVRFTVNSDGTVTNASVRRSSGHDLLDQATLDLLQRVSPLPRFPRVLTRSSITLTLPIEYSLQTR